MLTYKNETGKDLKITVHATKPDEIDSEVTIKAGETYNVPAEQETEFLRWMLNAKTQGESEPDDNEARDEAEDKTVKEDGENDSTDNENEQSDNKTETETVKNDRNFDIEVKYKVNDEDKVETVKAGEEIEVPKSEAKSVKKQIAEAEDSKQDDKKDELAEERQALAEERAKLAEEKAEMDFAKLCEAGKAVPAQKDAYMALRAYGQGAALAEGNEKDISKLLDNFIESAPAHGLMEEKGMNGDGDDKGAELSDEEKEVAEVFGNTAEEIKANRKEK